MMNNLLNPEIMFSLLTAFAVGLTLGAFYFTALWRTVKSLPETPHPVRLMLGSFALRIAVALTGFYFVMGEHWQRLAVALMGFIFMKVILTRRFGINKAI